MKEAIREILAILRIGAVGNFAIFLILVHI